MSENKKPQNVGHPPLSRFRTYDDLIFISGQVPIKDGAIVSDDFEEQVRQTLENIRLVVTDAGGSLRTILKCNCYVRKQEDLQTFNAIYRDFFQGLDMLPARTTLIASPPNTRVLVEIEAIASIDA